MDIAIVWALAQKEMRDALRNRWFLLYTVSFVALSLAFSYMALAGAGIVGFAGFGRTAASLINLVLLMAPLIALTIGVHSLVGEQERGTLSHLLVQPVRRSEVFLGKYLGLTLALLASLALGFGISGVVMALNSTGSSDPAVYIRLTLLAFLLSAAMLSIGFLLSAFTNRESVATGIGLFLWLLFVFFGDLGLMGSAVAMRLPIDSLFWLSLGNPSQVFKLAAILDLHGGLDLLGPAGLYATREFGANLPALLLSVLLMWSIVPAALAMWRFGTKSDF
jgi:Cu-processing system permease protein